MSAKQLLHFALNRMDEATASRILQQTGAEFRVGTQWLKVVDGSLVREDGSRVGSALGSVTGFRVADFEQTANGQLEVKERMTLDEAVAFVKANALATEDVSEDEIRNDPAGDEFWAGLRSLHPELGDKIAEAEDVLRTHWASLKPKISEPVNPNPELVNPEPESGQMEPESGQMDAGDGQESTGAGQELTKSALDIAREHAE